jgi:hypothetical protein
MIISIFDQTEQLTYDATMIARDHWNMTIDGCKFDEYLTVDVFNLAREYVAPIA